MNKLIDGVIDRTLLCAFGLYIWLAIVSVTVINAAYLLDFTPITNVADEHHGLYRFFNIQTAWCFLLTIAISPLILFIAPSENRGALRELAITLFVIVFRGVVIPMLAAIVLLITHVVPFLILIYFAMNGNLLGASFGIGLYFFIFSNPLSDICYRSIPIIFRTGPSALVKTEAAIKRVKQHVDYRKPTESVKAYLLSELRG